MRTLPGDLAEAVARQLIAASLAEDPEQAYRHAQAARQLAARVGVVRESVGIAAYRAGHWAEALAELRAARRLTGRSAYLPMMADSERALGRPDRALDLVTGPQAEEADRATRIELKIIESGICRDQGLPGAAVVALQILSSPTAVSAAARPGLYYAYADALLDAGRDEGQGVVPPAPRSAPGRDRRGRAVLDELTSSHRGIPRLDGRRRRGATRTTASRITPTTSCRRPRCRRHDARYRRPRRRGGQAGATASATRTAKPGPALRTAPGTAQFEIHYLPPGDPGADDRGSKRPEIGRRQLPAANTVDAMTAASSTARPAKR